MSSSSSLFPSIPSSTLVSSVSSVLSHLSHIDADIHRPVARALQTPVTLTLENKRIDHTNTTIALDDKLEPITAERSDELSSRFVSALSLFLSLSSLGRDPRHPGYLPYLPPGGLATGAFADLMVALVNKHTSYELAAPGLYQIEKATLRWLCDKMGYPPLSYGYLVSGGSMTIWSAVIIARNEKCATVEQAQKAIIYAQPHVHFALIKAVRMAGLPAHHLRKIPFSSSSSSSSLPDYRICCSALRHQIAADRAAGYFPLMIVGCAGTTLTGAVDDLQELSEIAKAENVWLHVDAAYGGGFMLTEQGRTLMHGISLSDSITIDPHKSLFLPYGTGCLLVRDRACLYRTYSVDATNQTLMRSSLAKTQSSSSSLTPSLPLSYTVSDSAELSPEQTRSFLSLRLWLSLKVYGEKAFSDTLTERLNMTKRVAGAVIGRKIDVKVKSEVDDVEIYNSNNNNNFDVDEAIAGDVESFELVLASPIVLSVLTFRLQLLDKPVLNDVDYCTAHARRRRRLKLTSSSSSSSSSSLSSLSSSPSFSERMHMIEDAATLALLSVINSHEAGDIFLHEAKVNEREVIRLCILSFRVTEKTIDTLIDRVKSALTKMITHIVYVKKEGEKKEQEKRAKL